MNNSFILSETVSWPIRNCVEQENMHNIYRNTILVEMSDKDYNEFYLFSFLEHTEDSLGLCICGKWYNHLATSLISRPMMMSMQLHEYEVMIYRLFF